jgi:hypothetical protein
MSAKYLRPGAYRVSHAGQSVTVIAGNPCDALMIAARIFKIAFETEKVAA